jgi:predicted ribosome quality control (RQC) complex YloA/Tae2 family protein
MKIETIFIDELDKEFTFYIGENKNDNFNVIDNANDNDLWFHANNISSCHVVALIPERFDKKYLKYIIKWGALLCKTRTSKLKDLNDVEIMYTYLSNVTKTKTPGLVNVKNKKTIII